MSKRKKREIFIQYDNKNLSRKNFYKLAIGVYILWLIEIIGGYLLLEYFGVTWWLYIGLTILGGAGLAYEDILFCSYKGYKKKMQARNNEDEIK